MAGRRFTSIFPRLSFSDDVTSVDGSDGALVGCMDESKPRVEVVVDMSLDMNDSGSLEIGCGSSDASASTSSRYKSSTSLIEQFTVVVEFAPSGTNDMVVEILSGMLDLDGDGKGTSCGGMGHKSVVVDEVGDL